MSEKPIIFSGPMARAILLSRARLAYWLVMVFPVSLLSPTSELWAWAGEWEWRDG